VVVGVLVGVAIAFGAFVLEQQKTASEGERICKDFIDLKNAGDPKANDLLASTPGPPQEPVTPEEADRLDAQFFLRQNFRVLDVRPQEGKKGQPQQFVLVVKGSFASEILPGRAGQRVLVNPDIVVQVQNGQIHGVSARLHIGK
jgi:hypothetical protein